MKDTSKFSVKKIMSYFSCQNRISFLFLAVKILKTTFLQVIDIVKAWNYILTEKVIRPFFVLVSYQA